MQQWQPYNKDNKKRNVQAFAGTSFLKTPFSAGNNASGESHYEHF